MAIGRISGPMLYNNLDRQGVDLSIDANLVYFDVANRRVGINTAAPNYALDSSGNAKIANLSVLGATVSSNSGTIAISSITAITSNTNAVSTATGALVVSGGAGVAGNLYVGGTIHADHIVSDNNQVLSIDESMVYLTPTASYPYSYEIGFYSQFTGAAANNYQHTGVVRNHNDNYWYFFSNVTEPTGNTINLSNANVVLDTIKSGGAILANNTPSTSTSTGALIVSGGVGVAGNIVGSNFLFANGVSIVATIAAGSYGNANVASYLPTYTGNVAAGNFLGNIAADIISPYRTNVTVFNSATAVGLPSGDSSTRPATSAVGYLRYNTGLGTIEFYGGAGWVPLTNSVSDQQITPDGVSQTFGLTQSTTASGIIVSINGTLQNPSTAYTVSGSNITFTETPLVTDIVDVRFLATTSTVVSADSTIVDSANISLGTVLKIIDTFDATIYRSARYTVSSSTTADSQLAEMLVLQNSGTAAIQLIGNVRTGANTVTYSANISGSTVNLLATSSVNSAQLRLQKTYFIV
jgi:hypothetical protein